MNDIVVDARAAVLRSGDVAVACAIGREGVCAESEKREGDGRTPIGDWPVHAALLRPDRAVAPPPALPWRWLRAADGWCDDPADPDYNRPVRHPCRASAERLWRDDDRYDAIVVLGHNDRPPVADFGSAIFLHIGSDRPTDGCVAIAREAMAVLLATLAPGDRLRIEAGA